MQSRLLSTRKDPSTSIKSNTKQNGSRGCNDRNNKDSNGNNINNSARKNHSAQQAQPVRKNAATARTGARSAERAKPGTGAEAGAGIGANPKPAPTTKSNQSKKKSKTNPSRTTNLASQSTSASPIPQISSPIPQASASIPQASVSTPQTLSSPSSSPSSSIAHTSLDNSIPDYKHSNTPPSQDLDNLQQLVNGLVSTNSTVSKRAILAEHPHQAPLLAWIYDPLRQFHVRPGHIIKYAQRRAQQRDKANTTTSSSTGRSSKTMDVRGSEGSSTTTDVELWPELSQRQKTQATARTTALGQGYETLSGLLNALSTRAISGHTALDAILLFMSRFCGTTSSTSASHVESIMELLNTPRSRLLLKILDKNLKAGCSVGLIREVYPTLIPGFHVALGHSLLRLEDARAMFTDNATNDKEKTKNSKRAGSAAGTKVEAEASMSPTTAARWFASRKLDGVRCLIRIDRMSGGIETLSRSGRDFESLSQIRDVLQDLVSGRGRSANDGQTYRDQFFRRAFGMNRRANDVSSLPEAMILDGEVCVFLTEPVQDAEETTDPGCRNGTVVIGGGDEGLGRENFLKAVSFVKRGMIEDKRQDEDDKEELDDGLRGFQGGKDQRDTVLPNRKNNNSISGRDENDNDLATDSEKTMYCVFDCLTDKEFWDRSGTRVFSERILSLSKALNNGQQQHGVRSQERQGFSAQSLIKILSQTKIESFKQLERMVEKGMKRGWEGVMLRKDVGYEGKRSRNLLKIKQFQDAEFIVQEAMLGSMRLPVEGRFEELDNVLTNVVVLHRRNRVRVGSGFSVEDRIRFGKDPSQILGKTITVQYFEESKTFTGVNNSGVIGESSLSSATTTTTTTDSNATSTPVQTTEDEDGTVWSLRFPTVKAIYGAGPRQM
ncbi:hypothetical protein BGZ51_000437 [Haplosporangium sp. Z 767]|nr:hypothetical protein BGZ51_000437 [Haplosporangium sp. Z 767]